MLYGDLRIVVGGRDPDERDKDNGEEDECFDADDEIPPVIDGEYKQTIRRATERHLENNEPVFYNCNNELFLDRYLKNLQLGRPQTHDCV